VEAVVTSPTSEFWSGKRVLLTGHTGFKGAWLAMWLHRRGAQVTGLSLEPDTDALFFSAGVQADVDSRIGDIREMNVVRAVVRDARPQVVFHLAAQAIVRQSYADPVATFDTNTRGTVHVLEALRDCSDVKAVVIVTTDKVYANDGSGRAYRETDPLGGHDPYSASKAAAELVVASYRDAFLRTRDVAVSSARAGNVIGGGDWAADRLIPDAARAWARDECLTVRNPGAVRPWQHVLEPLAGYLALAESTWHKPALAGAYNIGPDAKDAATVSDVIALAHAAYGKGQWRIEPQHDDAPHEAHHLTLDASHAEATLGLRPRWSLAKAVAHTMDWYRLVDNGADARAASLADIDAYEVAR
jgi:CDP-glucose 4,6-dehydratase